MTLTLSDLRESPTPQLIGRDVEVAWIDRFVDDIPTVGGTLFLTGVAGVGKSRLLAEARDRATMDGIRVSSCAGGEFEAEISYASLQQLLQPALHLIDDLPDAQANALRVALGLGEGVAPRPLAIGTAVLSLLSRATVDGPLLLTVDDLPWVDRASASVLGFLARRLVGTGVGMVATFRSTDPPAFARDETAELEVEPLDAAASNQLLTDRYSALPARLRTRILDEAGGNPLALIELARGLERDLDAAPAIGAPRITLPRRLNSLFAARIAELTDSSRHSLLLAALDGRTRLRELRAIGVDPDALVDAEHAGIVHLDPATMSISFTHPLMRAAVVDAADFPARRSAHLTIAQALTDDPDRRAWHLADAATSPDDQIADDLEAIAHRAIARGDTGAAVTALVRAARLSEDGRAESRRLAEAAYLGADITGELAHAAQLLSEARRADPNGMVSLHAAAAAGYMAVNADGDVDTAYRVLLRAIENGDHSWTADNVELIEALSTLLLLCWWAGKPDYWAPLHRAIERFGDEVPELLFIQSRAFTDTARLGAPVRARLVELINDQEVEHDPNRIIRVNTSSVYLDLLGGCRAGAWRLIEDGRSGGAVRSSLGAYMHLCLDDFGTGRWDEQERLADEGLEVCRQNGYGFIIWYFLFHKALLAAVRGEHDEAFRWAAELTTVTSARNAIGAEKFGHHARTLAAASQGDWDAAFRYAEALSPAGQLAPYTPHALWVAFDLVEAAMRTGRTDAAEAHVRAMLAADTSAISPRMAMLTRAAQALTASSDEAEELFEAAISIPDAASWQFDYARVQLAYGDWLRRNSAAVRSRDHLHLALDLFDKLGARGWSEKTRETLRAAGAREQQHAAETAGLTTQERAIVELAAQGLSNKEIGTRLFLSPRTVSGHLYRAFPKLGVTSRASLRDVLAQQASRDWRDSDEIVARR